MIVIGNGVKTLEDLANQTLIYVGYDPNLDSYIESLKSQISALQKELAEVKHSPERKHQEALTAESVHMQMINEIHESRLAELLEIKQQFDNYNPPSLKHLVHYRLMGESLNAAIAANQPLQSKLPSKAAQWAEQRVQELQQKLQELKTRLAEEQLLAEQQRGWLEQLTSSLNLEPVSTNPKD